MTFSGDGKTLAIALNAKRSFDPEKNKKLIDRVELWNTTNWKIRATLPKEPGPDFRTYGDSLKVWGQMAMSADGKLLAGIPARDSIETTVELWDTTTQTMRVIDKGGVATFLAFMPNGQSLLIGSRKGVKLVNTTK